MEFRRQINAVDICDCQTCQTNCYLYIAFRTFSAEFRRHLNAKRAVSMSFLFAALSFYEAKNFFDC